MFVSVVVHLRSDGPVIDDVASANMCCITSRQVPRFNRHVMPDPASAPHSLLHGAARFYESLSFTAVILQRHGTLGMVGALSLWPGKEAQAT